MMNMISFGFAAYRALVVTSAFEFQLSTRAHGGVGGLMLALDATDFTHPH
jgi:hypothetical protein